LNIAFEQSTGKYIFNLADDDCFFDNNVLLDWVNEFIKTGALVMTAKRAVYSADLTTLSKIEPDSWIIDRLNNKQPKDLFEINRGQNYILGCVTAKKREIISQFPYDPSYKIIEDYPVILKMLRHNTKIHYFDRIVIKYRVGGISDGDNINSKYLKESDRLFKNEVLPYTTNKFKARLEYYKWKKNIKKYQNYKKRHQKDKEHVKC